MKIVSVILLFLLCATAVSQNNNTQIEYPSSVIRLHVLAPGITFEKNIIKNSTIVFDLGSGFSYQYLSVNGESQSDYYFIPYFKVEPRVYRNLKKRKELNKQTNYYSGQYFGFQAKVGLPTKQIDLWQSYGPLWGFQKTFGKKGYWNIGLGFGAFISDKEIDFGGIGNLEFGFILN